MNVILDILTLGILAGSIFLAIRKGFMKSIIGLAGIILAIALAISFSGAMGDIINRNFVKPFFRNSIVSSFSNALQGEVDKNVKVDENTKLGEVKINEMFSDDETPKFLKDILSSLNISAESAKQELNNVMSSEETKKNLGNFVDNLIDKSGISKAISGAIAFVVIFLVVIILAKIAELIIGALAKMPIIKSFDKVLGAGLGVINGVIVIFIMCIIVRLLSGYITSSDGAPFDTGVLEKTFIFKYFYQINPFTIFKFGNIKF